MWRSGGNHAVAARFQHRRHQMADVLIVVHYEDGFAAVLCQDRSGDFPFGRRRQAGRARQVDGKRAAPAGLAGYLDVSSALLDDAVNGGESKAGAVADFLSGEEWLEDMALGFLVHALTGIAEGEANVRYIRQIQSELRTAFDVGGFDGQNAA